MPAIATTTVRPARLPIPRDAVLKRLGHRPGRSEESPRLEQLLDEMTALAESLFAPAGLLADLTLKEPAAEAVHFVETPVIFNSSRLARHLGYRLVDTGMMYRAITCLALDEGADLHDEAALAPWAQPSTRPTTASQPRARRPDASSSTPSAPRRSRSWPSA